jgi:hypothetical protein
MLPQPMNVLGSRISRDPAASGVQAVGVSDSGVREDKNKRESQYESLLMSIAGSGGASAQSTSSSGANVKSERTVIGITTARTAGMFDRKVVLNRRRSSILPGPNPKRPQIQAVPRKLYRMQKNRVVAKSGKEILGRIEGWNTTDQEMDDAEDSNVEIRLPSPPVFPPSPLNIQKRLPRERNKDGERGVYSLPEEKPFIGSMSALQSSLPVENSSMLLDDNLYLEAEFQTMLPAVRGTQSEVVEILAYESAPARIQGSIEFEGKYGNSKDQVIQRFSLKIYQLQTHINFVSSFQGDLLLSSLLCRGSFIQ